MALIMAVGQIVSGKGSATELQPMREVASTPMCAQLRAARLDPQVRAVVLRVDSPGAAARSRLSPVPLPQAACTISSA